MNIYQMLEIKRHSLLRKKNVVSVGIGYKYTHGEKTNQMCIQCLVTSKIKPSDLKKKDLIPQVIGHNYPTDVVESGELKAEDDPTAKHRPAPAGISIGHKDVTAGTLGCWVIKNGAWHILSNNHVIANENNAEIGDPILQPGIYDGGLGEDVIAYLSEYIGIKFSDNGSECPIAKGTARIINCVAMAVRSKSRLVPVYKQEAYNLVDAALALVADNSHVKSEIMNIGIPKGFSEASLGTKVVKMGRTTGLTTGEIIQIHATSVVNYGNNQRAYFEDQLIAGNMSAGGDSGSVVLEQSTHKIIGLLFAGSDTTTVINRITNVRNLLGFSL